MSEQEREDGGGGAIVLARFGWWFHIVRGDISAKISAQHLPSGRNIMKTCAYHVERRNT